MNRNINLQTPNTEQQKLISIVIPIFNEAAVIPELVARLRRFFQTQEEYRWEVICVENGSTDGSYQLLLLARESDPRFKIIRLSRNFTADGGVAAGLQYSSGDCAVLMDADLQDPPELIAEFIKKWIDGADVVYGVIVEREGIAATRKLVNRFFYFMINRVSNGMLPENVTAFRLLDKAVYRVLNDMPERNRFTRGLCAWTGFKQEGVEFVRAKRFAGDSKAGFSDIFMEALDAFFSFSFVPLRIITAVGICLSIFCLVFLVFQLFMAFMFSSTLPGYRTLIVLLLMMFGFMFISLGVVGEYVARIFDEVKQRPLFIVRNILGVDFVQEKVVSNSEY